jgi:uncharacterized low-complexity protein
MIEASGEDLGVDGTVVFRDAGPGRAEWKNFAGDGRVGQRRESAAENHDTQIGPTAEGEIDREYGHISEGTAGRGRCGAKNSGRSDGFGLI